MIHLKCLIRLLILLVFPISIIQAQEAIILDDTFAGLFDSASACLHSSNSNCEVEFDRCTDYLNSLSNDTVAGSYFLMLGIKRMRAGRWDSISHNMFVAADQRYRASGEPCEIVKSQFALTRFARFKGASDSSIVLANRALAAANACGEKTKIARAHNFLGSAFVDNGNYSKGLMHYQESDRIYTSIGDSTGLASLMLDMATMYSEMHEKDKSREYTIKAAKLFKSAGEDMRYAVALVDFSADLIDVKLADSALKVLPIAEAIIHDQHPRAEAYMEQNYGSAYYLNEKYEKSIEHYKKGLKLNEKVGDQGLAILLNIFLSECYLKLNEPAEAQKSALKADSIAKFTPRNFKRSQAYLALAESAYASKNYDLSYLSFKRFIILRDSLLGADKRAAIAATESSYEAEKKEKAIEYARQENALLAAKNKAATNGNFALAACLILFVVLTIGLISRKNGRIKIQQSLLKVNELENEKLNQELAYRKRELSTKALHIARNSQVLGDLKNELQTMSDTESRIVKSLTGKLRIREIQDKNWESFIHEFNELNPDFHKSLIENYGALTNSEIRLAALIRMGIQTKDIATMLNISDQGVKKGRHRLRKKLRIESAESLESIILRI